LGPASPHRNPSPCSEHGPLSQTQAQAEVGVVERAASPPTPLPHVTKGIQAIPIRSQIEAGKPEQWGSRRNSCSIPELELTGERA
ncbi:MAG: hypothetical protein NZ572_06335, partial [Thermoflexus sp.]|nr:hypothetical protein [Thermoflexus sp.]